jgi:soluble lytic murein transglycosylase-like protein
LRFRFFWVFLLFPLLLLNLSCAKIDTTIVPAAIASPSVSSGAGSQYSMKYDLAFKKWGEFYFPFDDWKWWKSQGIAESDLDPKAISWCGAQGIMQIMPKTGIGLGLKNPWDPEESIQAGIKYDGQVDTFFKPVEITERRKLMFAGYNAGPGNIQKARKLANSDEWSAVADQLHNVTGKNSEETIGYVSRIYKLKEII